MSGLKIGGNTLTQLIERLGSHYPWALPAMRRDLLFYDDVQPIRFGDLGDKDGVDLASWSLSAIDAYWDPADDLKPHMRAAALGNKNRLRVPETANPNFGSFPVGYPPELADKEIDDAVRVARWRDGAVVLQKSNYLDQLATNISADLPIEARSGASFRSLDKSDDQLWPFEECQQANTVGVAILAVDRNWVPIVAKRGLDLKDAASSHQQLGVMQSGWHCFSSGVLQWQDAEEGRGLLGWLQAGLYREIEEELGIRRSEGYFKLIPYAFARELERAGKPQIFMIAKFHLTAGEIKRVLAERTPKDAHEYRSMVPMSENVTAFISRKDPKRYREVRTLDQLSLRSLTRERLQNYLNSNGEHVTFELMGSLALAVGRLQRNPEWDRL